MATQDYTEAFDLILDWRDSVGRDFTGEERVVVAEAQAQITAYTGRFYGEIRHDIARCAVASLGAMQPEVVDNVTPMRPSRADIIKETVYVPSVTKVSR